MEAADAASDAMAMETPAMQRWLTTMVDYMVQHEVRHADGRHPEMMAQLLARIDENDPSLVDVDRAFFKITSPYPYSLAWNDELLQLLAIALRGNQHVRSLDLKLSTAVTDLGIQALIDVSQSCVLSKVSVLGMGLFMGTHPRITQGMTDRLVRQLLHNALTAVRANDPAATFLDLSEMALRDTHIPTLVDALRGNRHVVFLSLRDNLITGAGVAELLPALRSSAVSTVTVDRCPASTDQAVPSALQDVCVPHSLALLRANAVGLDEIDTKHIWHSSLFNDSAAEALADAMANNTVLATISIEDTELPAGGRSFSDVGAAHLERVLGNGACSVVCVYYPSDVALSPTRIQQIGRACFGNALRRVHKNDPTLVHLDLNFGQDAVESEDSRWIIGAEEMIRFAAALHCNTELRHLSVPDCPTEVMKVLLRVLPSSGIEDATYYPHCMSYDADETSRRYRETRRLHDELRELCAANRSRRVAAEASLLVHRPFQRMLLCALFTTTLYGIDCVVHKGCHGLILPKDFLGMIAGRLEKSKTSPFTHAGHHQLTKHKTAFAWHTMRTATNEHKRRRT